MTAVEPTSPSPLLSRRRFPASESEDSAQSDSLLHSPSRTSRPSFWARLVYALGLSTQHPADLHIASSQDRFMLKFERNYGPVHPEFFSGSYASALAQANSQEKLLFVYLHSEEHDDAHLFCNQVLRNPEVIAFLNTNCIVFAADVCDPDGYRTAMKLRVEGYPFCCVVHRVGHNLMLRCKVEGLIDVEELLSKLGKTLQDVVNARVRQRQAEVERNEMASRSILEHQDREYEEALAADRLREQQIEEERQKILLEKKLKEEEEQQRQTEIMKEEARKEAKRLERETLLKSLTSEPDEKSGKPVTIQFRLPNGTAVKRRFNPLDTIAILYKFVQCHELSDVDGVEIVHWEIVTNFPPKAYKDMSQTLQDAGLSGPCVLFVKEVL